MTRGGGYSGMDVLPNDGLERSDHEEAAFHELHVQPQPSSLRKYWRAAVVSVCAISAISVWHGTGSGGDASSASEAISMVAIAPNQRLCVAEGSTIFHIDSWSPLRARPNHLEPGWQVVTMSEPRSEGGVQLVSIKAATDHDGRTHQLQGRVQVHTLKVCGPRGNSATVVSVHPAPQPPHVHPAPGGMDCNAGLDNVRGWSVSKRNWCCHHERKGCVDASGPPPVEHDCNAGFDRWQTGWSAEKKMWCCARQSKGCETHRSPGGSSSPLYDCDKDYGTWQNSWSAPQREWCCSNRGRACPTTSSAAPLYNCNTRETWTAAKKHWCCTHEKKGCSGASAPLYNCYTKEVWADAKREWCCINAKQGCSEGSTPVYNCYTKEVWADAKREWCCINAKQGCSEGSAPLYNCYTKEVWSDTKREWCCSNMQQGCSEGSAPIYDCNEDLNTWYSSWTGAKKDWCCKNMQKGCHGTTTGEPHFDCNAGYDRWVLGWSVEKMQYCCRTMNRACEIPTTTTTSTLITWLATTHTATTTEGLTTLTSTTTTEELVFDCSLDGATVDQAVRGWSVWKKRWCCSNQNVGCPPKNQHSLTGIFTIEHLCHEDLEMHPLHRKLVWQTIKDSFVKLLSKYSLWVGVAKKLRRLSEAVEATDVWLEDWKSGRGYMTTRFVIQLPESLSYDVAKSRVTCDSISSSLVPALTSLDDIESMTKTCRKDTSSRRRGVVSKVHFEVEPCTIDMHTGKLPCSCKNGEKVSEDHCPPHGGNICSSCQAGYHLVGQRCVPNVCRCDNGIAAMGVTCNVSGALACGFCNEGFHLARGAEGHYVCEPNKCFCDSGKAAEGTACVANREHICASCELGYHVNNVSKICMPNLCFCTDGSPPNRGSPLCPEHRGHTCATCMAGMHVDDLTMRCVANKCKCDEGTAAVGVACVQNGAEICTDCKGNAYLHHDGTCGNKKCVCTNGVPVDEGSCTTNRGNLCKECDHGFALWGNSQQCVKESCRCSNGVPKADCMGSPDDECGKCNAGYHLQGERCVANVCRCSHGSPASGSTCLEDGLEVCKSCYNGYHSVLATGQSGRTKVLCVANECSCTGGTAATAYSSPQCHGDGQEVCAMCDPGHTRNKNHLCVRNQCQCEHGTGTTYMQCPAHGATDCASCHLGYEVTEDGAMLAGTMTCKKATDTDAAFDCTAGYAKRWTGWSTLKKSWCCEHHNVGCIDHLALETEVCKPYYDASECSFVGCCKYENSNCKPDDTQGMCHPKRVITFTSSVNTTDPRGFCLAAFGGIEVSVQRCNPYERMQVWTWNNVTHQLKSDLGLCVSLDGEKTENFEQGRLRMAECRVGDDKVAPAPMKWIATVGADVRVTTLKLKDPGGSGKTSCLTVETVEQDSSAVLRACHPFVEGGRPDKSQSWSLPTIAVKGM